MGDRGGGQVSGTGHTKRHQGPTSASGTEMVTQHSSREFSEGIQEAERAACF